MSTYQKCSFQISVLSSSSQYFTPVSSTSEVEEDGDDDDSATDSLYLPGANGELVRLTPDQRQLRRHRHHLTDFHVSSWMAVLVVGVLMVVTGGLKVIEIAEGILMEGLMYRLRKSGHRVMEISRGVMEISWVVMEISWVVMEE